MTTNHLSAQNKYEKVFNLKVRILSSTNWREEILEFANADALPDKWNTPNGPKFTSFIKLPIAFRKDGYYNQTEVRFGMVALPKDKNIKQTS